MTSFADLPSVFVCKLLGYLDWRTKLELVEVIPQWSSALYSVDAWPYVRNIIRESLPRPPWSTLLESQIDITESGLGIDEDDSMFRECLRTYGKYFQSLKLVLEFEDVYMCHMDQTLLNLVINHCSSLRSLVVHFPRGLGFTILQCIGDYRFMLNSIPKRCKKIKHIAVQILEYTPVMETVGISELFEVDDQQGLVSKLTALDFSYVSTRNIPRADFLCCFTRLKTVKVADYLLSHDTIAMIFRNGLKDLHVYRNSLTGPLGLGGTHFTDFASEVEWSKLAQDHPDTNVHYNYSCAKIGRQTFKTNPLLKSLVLDSLFNKIKPETLESIGNHFPQLRFFAQLSSEWNYTQYDDDNDPESQYCERLLTNCPNLETFITSQTVTSSDLLSMAGAGPVKTIVVNMEEIFYDLDYVQDQRAYLNKRMTIMIGQGWQALSKEEFPKYTMRLLA